MSESTRTTKYYIVSSGFYDFDIRKHPLPQAGLECQNQSTRHTVTNVASVGSFASESVSGVSTTGGLVGQSDGAITQSSTNVVVTANGASGRYFGGLLGFNNAGTVTQSHASGSVTAQGNNSSVGGLIGFQLNGITSESYATGAVNGGNYHAGGLLGRNDGGTITQSYASGAVSGNVDNGGLAGGN